MGVPLVRISWEVNNLTGDKLSSAQRQEYWKIIQLAVDADVCLVYGSDAHKIENIGGENFTSKVLAKLTKTNGINRREKLT